MSFEPDPRKMQCMVEEKLEDELEGMLEAEWKKKIKEKDGAALRSKFKVLVKWRDKENKADKSINELVQK